MSFDRDNRRPDSNQSRTENQPSSIEVRSLTNDEIIALREQVLRYIEIMQEAFTNLDALFTDLENKYQMYRSRNRGTLMPEHEFIAEVAYMEDALYMRFMKVGSAVSEIGATIKAVLKSNDRNMLILEPYQLGEAFLSRLFAMGRNKTSNYIEKNANAGKINALLRMLDENPQLKQQARLLNTRKTNQDFFEDTWFLMRQVRNAITHLQPLPSLFAFWAVGKHYFPELHSTNLTILSDDNEKAAIWDDQLEEDASMSDHTESDKGVVLNCLAHELPVTIYSLKREALSKGRASGLQTGAKNTFRGS